MKRYFDALETRDPEERERALMAALPRLIEHAQRHAPGFGRIFQGVTPGDIDSRAALAQLPVTRKSELLDLQREAPPFAGFNVTPLGELARIFMSPGPIFEPEARREDYWRMARPLFAAGFRSGELIHNSFSYHLTPAGSMLEGGALKLGCAVIPAGTGQTELQVQAIAALAPAGYVGTPSFLKIIVEKAAELQTELSSLKKALVSAEALPESLRAWLKERGIAVLQTYASADLGNIAYETEAGEGLVLDEELILEIVRPGTGDPVAEGEIGEVVVTVLNTDYPLVRFGTGDLSAVIPGVSACGRTNTRLRGWLGRADQRTKVRGMFVDPAQVAAVLKRHREIAKARLVVDNSAGQDGMTLRCEVSQADPALAKLVAETVRDITQLRCAVELLSPGALPNDGKVIEDTRKHL